ncbi:hypothetical protein M501DRAFT_991640 [Patellaria atrata CBS 101060]|uniref:Rhodopsin domain-containing protein n=1 Tax=Patellaria atrata CBS 101060 TaxID=1346257 RepID=A0A9P4SBI5_9PEZI|nr:hypothetical protein M501DRAFT_991640 [Patellaria atrata CBS 101060]
MLELVVESWIWFAFVAIITIARFVSRSLLFESVYKLQVDDWIMVFALLTYTTLIVSINIVADASSNLLPPDYDITLLTTSDIRGREYGSKFVFVVEQMQCLTIWAVKACLLIMYYRLTIALKENICVKVLAGYVAFSFVFMEIFYLGVWCRPITNYWAVPTPNSQCSAATNHLITNAVFNISSDVLMLVMALQMLIRSKLPVRRKAILCCIFGLGVFVILSAVLNKYYSFTNPYGSLWTFWYVRESSTALLVANLPFTWTLLRRIFNLHAFDGTSLSSNHHSNPPPFHSQRTARNRHAWDAAKDAVVKHSEKAEGMIYGRGSGTKSQLGKERYSGGGRDSRSARHGGHGGKFLSATEDHKHVSRPSSSHGPKHSRPHSFHGPPNHTHDPGRLSPFPHLHLPHHLHSNHRRSVSSRSSTATPSSPTSTHHSRGSSDVNYSFDAMQRDLQMWNEQGITRHQYAGNVLEGRRRPVSPMDELVHGRADREALEGDEEAWVGGNAGETVSRDEAKERRISRDEEKEERVQRDDKEATTDDEQQGVGRQWAVGIGRVDTGFRQELREMERAVLASDK